MYVLEISLSLLLHDVFCCFDEGEFSLCFSVSVFVLLCLCFVVVCVWVCELYSEQKNPNRREYDGRTYYNYNNSLKKTLDDLYLQYVAFDDDSNKHFPQVDLTNRQLLLTWDSTKFGSYGIL